MVKNLVWLSAILLLNACSTSHVNVHNGQIMIQSGNSASLYQGQLVARHNENFSTLFIEQKILKFPEGNLIVYEHARTDLQYEFEPSLQRVIGVVFDAVQMMPVYIGSQLSAYQIALPNGQWLNLLAQQSDTQELHFIYGMNTKQFTAMIKKIDADAPLALDRQVIQIKKPHQALLSRWTTWKVHFYPLVVPYQVSLFR